MDEADFDAAFPFPSEFPYEFHSPGVEPVESGSTGTESSDEEDFFAGLTRRLGHASIHDTRKEQMLTVPICNAEKTEVTMTVTDPFVFFACFFFSGKLTLFFWGFCRVRN